MSQDLAALDRQAITAAKQHIGSVAWPTVLLTALVLVAFAVNLAAFSLGLTPAWLSTLLLAALTYIAYTPLHEAVHGNVHGRHHGLKWLNDLCGYLAAPLIAVPYQSHRIEHFTHHRYTNQPDRDPDFMVSDMGRGPLQALVAVLRFIVLQNTFFARAYWHKATTRERAIYSAEVLVSLGWRAAFLVAVDQPGAGVVIVVGYLLGGFFTAYWFAYRPHVPYNRPERYRNTSSLIMPRWMKPLEWFWLGQNLHAIHHLFPRVPFYRYHTLHREIEPALRAHGTPIIGVFSREPVERA
ncbi:fatty acid desaturase family protein [Marinobacter sp. C2H3]|uniref:fatty acid desaturase family protein n=1 Tax=Marinobacter sp. C2H3 TaxID=3119003 RepID=UPI00300F38DB